MITILNKTEKHENKEQGKTPHELLDAPYSHMKFTKIVLTFEKENKPLVGLCFRRF